MMTSFSQASPRSTSRRDQANVARRARGVQWVRIVSGVAEHRVGCGRPPEPFDQLARYDRFSVIHRKNVPRDEGVLIIDDGVELEASGVPTRGPAGASVGIARAIMERHGLRSRRADACPEATFAAGALERHRCRQAGPIRAACGSWWTGLARPDATQPRASCNADTPN